MSKHQKQSATKTADTESPRKKPEFAEKSYQQRAKDAYAKFLSTRSKD